MTDQRYVLTSRAQRDLARLPVSVRRRALDALDRLVGPLQAGDRLKLAGGDDLWRLRVGDYRVIYELHHLGRIIAVLRVLPRGRAYRG